MTRKYTIVAGIFLLSIVFCCSISTAETYNFGGTTGNGEYSGTLAVDNSGNVAFTIAAATGPGASVQTTQNSNAGGGASATQETTAVGDSVFVGSGAASSNSDTASTGAHAIGNAEINSVQGAVAGGSGAAAGQMTEVAGRTAAAGSLGVSGSGYEASTTARVTDGGQIDTMQGAAAGSFSYNTAGQANSNAFFTGAADQIFGTPLVIDIDVTGAVAGQYSEIYAENGGQASSSATGHGNAATTQASITGEGGIATIQIAGVGQIGVEGLLDGISADGIVAGQDSLLESDNGGSASTRVSGANGYQAETGGEFNGNGMYGTIQLAGAGQIGIEGLGAVEGAVAGQNSLIESDNGGSASTCVSGANGYQAETGGEFSGNGMYGTTQIAGAGQIGIDGLLDGISADGAVAGQDSKIYADNGGTLFSSATDGNGYQADTEGQFNGNGVIGGSQIAGSGQIGIGELGTVEGAVAGQYAKIYADNGGYAYSSATNGNGYEVTTQAQYSGDGFMNTIQGAAAAGIGIPGTASVDGAVAGQYSQICSQGEGSADTYAGTTDLATQAETFAGYSGTAGGLTAVQGDGELMALQGAAIGQVDIPGFASVDGAVAGQYAQIYPGFAGEAIAGTAAQTGNGHDQVVVVTHSTNGNPINDILQGAAAGSISVPDAFSAEGAAAFQHSSSPAGNSMFSGAWHGATSDYDNTNTPGTQYALAGRVTNGGTIEGAEAWH